MNIPKEIAKKKAEEDANLERGRQERSEREQSERVNAGRFPDDPYKEVEAIRRRQNQELLQILEEEQKVQ